MVLVPTTGAVLKVGKAPVKCPLVPVALPLGSILNSVVAPFTTVKLLPVVRLIACAPVKVLDAFVRATVESTAKLTDPLFPPPVRPLPALTAVIVPAPPPPPLAP